MSEWECWSKVVPFLPCTESPTGGRELRTCPKRCREEGVYLNDHDAA